MVKKTHAKKHRTYREGGAPLDEERAVVEADVENRSWEPGRQGQGGEGLSHGYGGSAGSGAGPSGAEDKRKTTTREE